MSVLSFFKHLNKSVALALMTVAFLFTACVETGSGGRKISSKSTNLASGKNSAGSGTGSLPNNTGTGSTEVLSSQKVELSHFVDPFTGNYKKKLTIPKNYKGELHIAGINVASLQDKLIKVRFSFGLDRQSVVLNATVNRAPGIIPATDIQVLSVDMNSSPFKAMRLGYDLYDYNDYATYTLKEPVTDNLDSGLYCRALQLEDDSTFIPKTQTSTCSAATDKCLFAYAKIADATLYNSSGITGVPTRPQIWNYVSGVRAPSIATSLGTMCLPDSSVSAEIFQGLNDLFGLGLSGVSYNQEIVTGSFYRGPYRAINLSAWRVTDDAVFNTSGYGLFGAGTEFTSTSVGTNSMLFPRGGKVNLNQGIYYLGSSGDRFSDKSILTSDSNGVSKYVGGCNLRTMYSDVSTGEGMGSCTVTARVEIFYEKDGKEVSITTEKGIKLQLVKASLTNYEGKQVLSNNFKSCESSTTCGSDECCFNKRCWSKDLVTQCVDQLPIIGNQPVGANCATDYECSSLCCNQSTGSCAPHNPNGSQAVSCSKTAGQQCITKEFCKPEFVPNCRVIRGPIIDGKRTCSLQCPGVETYGECRAGVCIPPLTPTPPSFDPNDCSNAVDP